MLFSIFPARNATERKEVSNSSLGARAAQVVPHVHFHIIPRPQTEGVHKPGFAMFGRGQRSELDDDEGEELSRAMRAELVQEIKRIHREEGIDLSADLIDRGKL